MPKARREDEYIGSDGEVRDLDDAFFAKARRGRPPLPAGERKTRVTMYVDTDIVAHFKASGRGWQTRINEALRASVKRDGRSGRIPPAAPSRTRRPAKAGGKRGSGAS